MKVMQSLQNNFTEEETELFNEEEPPSPAIAKEKSKSPFAYRNLIARKKPNVQHLVNCSHESELFYSETYLGSTYNEWNSWQWQIRNSVTQFSQLKKVLPQITEQFDLNGGNEDVLPLRITPYYLSVVSRSPVLGKTVIPSHHENLIHVGENSDPLCEMKHSPVSNIVHRYPDRILFLITNFCSTYCRYCTRSHMVAKEKCHFNKETLEEAFRYIEEHTEIRDVLLSGGDPLTLSDSYLDYVLMRIRAIKHVEIVRIGTKVPVVMPQRITRNLINMLRKYSPLYINIHFTHPDELTEEVKTACKAIGSSGIPLGSQTVLLKGINDDSETIKSLMHGLLKILVRPYYLYQCDPILGSEHFRTSVEKGIDIIRNLRGFTSGYAVPTFVIDAPGGGGKIPLLPDYIQSNEDGKLVLKNFENKLFIYPNIVTDI